MNYLELRQSVINLTNLEVPYANRLLQRGFTLVERTELGTLLEQNNTEGALSLIKSKNFESIFPNTRSVNDLKSVLNLP